MFYETRARDKTLLPHDPFKAIIAPRPIGWISTRAKDGRVNLAPYSFFNAFASIEAPIVGFSSEGLKDSAAFARGERRVRVQSRDLRPDAGDERDLGAAAARGQRVRARGADDGALPAGRRAARRGGACEPGMQADAGRSGCKNHNGDELDNYLLLGEVVAFHIDDALIRDGRFDTAAARPLARCGYRDYAVTDRVIALARPAGGGDALEPKGST